MGRYGMRHWTRKLLNVLGYVIFNTRSDHGYARDGLFTHHNDHFRDDASFQAAYARGVKAGFGVDPRIEWRLHVALWAAANALRVSGDFVECGVNTGFISSAIMQYLNWGRVDRRFHLIDTFSGPVLTQFSEQEAGRLRAVKNALAKGAYVKDLERVRANFAEWPNVELIQGIVPEILPTVETKEVAFLHIDMNCALPECAALEHFWGTLPPGAVVLFDDYAYFDNDRTAALVDSMAAFLGAKILSLPTGQGLIIK